MTAQTLFERFEHELPNFAVRVRKYKRIDDKTIEIVLDNGSKFIFKLIKLGFEFKSIK